MKDTKNNGFFELLCLNDSSKLKEFLLMNGKGPKPRCPITFMNMADADEVKFYGNFAVVS